ncbi:MAG: division/cell wall cluster transcriptional repressor MraZ [Clostridia bacterium]|nr:division/cell wall cluster transcriptional repressor MraZ [Clostridia bacterium]
MLIGQVSHSLDAKGRLIIPLKFRADLGSQFVATRGLDGCVSLYPMEEWHRLAALIKAAPIAEGRTMQRYFFGFAEECETDAQGRVLLPVKLRSLAGLTREVVIVGVETHLEVWDAARWDELENSVDDADVIAALSRSSL